jgi:uncharacterized iron-regulated membrane protein
VSVPSRPAGKIQERPSRQGSPVRRRATISPRAYKLLWDAHSATGIVLGLALFVIFVCGAFALYRGELYQWADPALRAATTRVASVDALVDPILAADPPAPGSDLLLVWPFFNRPYFFLGYETASGAAASHWIVPATGEILPAAARSILPDLLNELHFFEQLGVVGRTISGFLGVLLAFGLVTGLLVHLRKLPEDLHTFRAGAKTRVALADAHAALGTIGLPFTAVFAVTGAYFSLLTLMYGAIVLGTLGGESDRLDSLIRGAEHPAYVPTGEPARPMSFDALLARAPGDWSELEVILMEVRGYGDRGGTVLMEAQPRGSLSENVVVGMDLTNGTVQLARPAVATPAFTRVAVSFGVLHFARFGGQLLRAIFFVLALAAAAVILTGNLVWLESRRRAGREAPALHVGLARLNSGVGAGLLVAIPALFLVTRLVPIDTPDRTGLEEAAFFGVWLVCIVGAALYRSALGSARTLGTIAGALCLLVPLANGVVTGAWPWRAASSGLWVIVGVDLAFLLGGLTLLRFSRPRQRSRGFEHPQEVGLVADTGDFHRRGKLGPPSPR